jgi:ribosomal protein L37AE/L43A
MSKSQNESENWLVDACPHCNSSNLNERYSEEFQAVPWRCNECGHEFAEPIERRDGRTNILIGERR